jgi:hypothetical protein
VELPFQYIHSPSVLSGNRATSRCGLGTLPAETTASGCCKMRSVWRLIYNSAPPGLHYQLKLPRMLCSASSVASGEIKTYWIQPPCFISRICMLPLFSFTIVIIFTSHFPLLKNYGREGKIEFTLANNDIKIGRHFLCSILKKAKFSSRNQLKL